MSAHQRAEGARGERETALQDSHLNALIENIKEHMSRMKEEDPRAYRDW